MAEENTTILELDTSTFEALKQGGYFAVSILGHTYKVALSELEGVGASDHKVCVQQGDEAGFLANVLVPDGDAITLTPLNGTLRIGVNLTGESDPKLATLPESDIDSETSNYGSYQLKQGAGPETCDAAGIGHRQRNEQLRFIPAQAGRGRTCLGRR